MTQVLANNVESALTSSILVGTTSIVVDDATAPNNSFTAPGSGAALATIMDQRVGPTAIEVITYTGVTDNGNGTHTLTGVLRGQENTTAQAFSAGAFIGQLLTHGAVAQLESDIAGKAASVHGHAISDVTNLQTTLDGKAASSHTHPISEITNLQTELDGKAASSHTHAIGDVTNLLTELNARPEAAVTETITAAWTFNQSLVLDTATYICDLTDNLDRGILRVRDSTGATVGQLAAYNLDGLGGASEWRFQTNIALVRFQCPVEFDGFIQGAATFAGAITAQDDLSVQGALKLDAKAGQQAALTVEAASPTPTGDTLVQLVDASIPQTWAMRLHASTGEWRLQNVTTGGNVVRVANDAPTASLVIKSNEIILNEASADQDVRVESDTQTHMLFVNGGNDRIGVKTSTPQSELDVNGTITATGLDIGAGTVRVYERHQATITAYGDSIFEIPVTSGTVYKLELYVLADTSGANVNSFLRLKGVAFAEECVGPSGRSMSDAAASGGSPNIVFYADGSGYHSGGYYIIEPSATGTLVVTVGTDAEDGTAFISSPTVTIRNTSRCIVTEL